MTLTRSGNGWRAEVDDNIMVWAFLPGMDLSAFGDEAYGTYEDLLDRSTLTGMVTVVKLDEPFSSDVFDIWEQSVQRADEAGIKRWAIVAEGIKALSLRGKIDTGGLDTLTTEERTEAVEWAKNA